MIKFAVGQTYQTSSIMDHNVIYKIKVLHRTAATMKVCDECGIVKNLRISVCRGRIGERVESEKVEQVKPKGSYSFAPVIAASDTKVLYSDWNKPKPADPDAIAMQRYAAGIKDGELMAELVNALKVVANCIADENGGTTLGTYEMGIVKAALAKVAS